MRQGTWMRAVKTMKAKLRRGQSHRDIPIPQPENSFKPAELSNSHLCVAATASNPHSSASNHHHQSITTAKLSRGQGRRDISLRHHLHRAFVSLPSERRYLSEMGKEGRQFSLGLFMKLDGRQP
ncbi:mannose-6-phosphate isomerase, class I [Sesbania bispinosa]|nr:mannose-6-phosphate isomerase, class I [Sesbania bispinosa]